MRQLIFVPAVNPRSVLLFFQKGSNPTSWSLRDYSQPGRVEVRYAEEFGWEAEAVKAKAEKQYSAPAVPTTDLAFWHRLTSETNAQLGLGGDAPCPALPPSRAREEFPLLAEDELLGLEKARKGEDMKRIRTSRNSEDWVTWNFLHLLQAVQPHTWWRTLDEAAAQFNPQARTGLSADDIPRLVYWKKAAPPPAYERASRDRMARSGDPGRMRRARSRGPVEGDSEIDVILESRRFLIFLEAKLGSDVSAHTTYDPARNQIARNIDCVLEAAGRREPVFWMLVRDTEPHRMYVQLIEQYRSNPRSLARELPHRDEAALMRISERLAIIRWRDLGGGWIHQTAADSLVEEVRGELLRRV